MGQFPDLEQIRNRFGSNAYGFTGPAPARDKADQGARLPWAPPLSKADGAPAQGFPSIAPGLATAWAGASRPLTIIPRARVVYATGRTRCCAGIASWPPVGARHQIQNSVSPRRTTMARWLARRGRPHAKRQPQGRVRRWGSFSAATAGLGSIVRSVCTTRRWR